MRWNGSFGTQGKKHRVEISLDLYSSKYFYGFSFQSFLVFTDEPIYATVSFSFMAPKFLLLQMEKSRERERRNSFISSVLWLGYLRASRKGYRLYSCEAY